MVTVRSEDAETGERELVVLNGACDVSRHWGEQNVNDGYQGAMDQSRKDGMVGSMKSMLDPNYHSYRVCTNLTEC